MKHFQWNIRPCIEGTKQYLVCNIKNTKCIENMKVEVRASKVQIPQSTFRALFINFK